jgi:MFS transporter, DHA2 family, metal-tetracycline-proton antiporter
VGESRQHLVGYLDLMTTGGNAEPVVAPITLRLLLAVLVTATVISVMSNSMITVLLPLIGRDFSASVAVLGWTATAFLLAFGVAALFHGRLSDVFGVRGVFCVGLLLFGLGSLLAALATGMPMLIIARVVQGLGGAAIRRSRL